MSEVAETTVSAIVDSQPAPEAKPRITVVTPENFDAYVSEKVPAVVDPEKAAAEEHEKVEAEKAKNKGEEPEIDHPDEKKKGKLNERFSELTKARKEAEEKAQKAADEAKAAKEAAEQAARERDELKAKYEPPKTEPDPKPARAQFQTDEDFAAALEEWTTDKVRREDAVERDRVAQAKAWQERQREVKKELPDYEEKVSKSDVKVSNEVRDAILDSEVGPKILYHLAENPELAVDIGKMTVAKALKAIGRIEATLEAKVVKEPTKPIAEISKAPEPISPIKNASAPVVRLSGHDAVPANMTYEDWKKARKAGKIQ